METLETISKRCSLKTHLSGKEVEPEKIDTILNAARLAPSARNTQTWRFIVVKDKMVINTLAKTAVTEGNMVISQAPVIIVICGRARDSASRDGKDYYLFDAGLAVENLLLAATELGLATHPMTGISEPEIKGILKIPDDVRVIAITPLAYPPEASYNEAAKERLGQRERKSLKDITYFNKWGEAEPA
ncbi:nitroreductase family protein [Chloroflexota bacterium]